MAVLIKNRQLCESLYRHLQLSDVLPGGPVTVTLQRWLNEREALRFYPHPVGVRLQADDDISLSQADLARLPLIALEFSKFTDGRSYSQARLLRERYGYRGELRAVGEVLRDQLYFMARCGIDAFELSPHQDAQEALSAFVEINIRYQPAADGKGLLSSPRKTVFSLPRAAG